MKAAGHVGRHARRGAQRRSGAGVDPDHPPGAVDQDQRGQAVDVGAFHARAGRHIKEVVPRRRIFRETGGEAGVRRGEGDHPHAGGLEERVRMAQAVQDHGCIGGVESAQRRDGEGPSRRGVEREERPRGGGAEDRRRAVTDREWQGGRSHGPDVSIAPVN